MRSNICIKSNLLALKEIKHFQLFSSLFVFVMLCLFALQGFDITDEGFVLTSYQNFFNNPESISRTFPCYFTCLTGAICYKFLFCTGWLSFRIANAFLLTVLYDIIYATFKEFIKYPLLYLLGYVIVMLDIVCAHGMLVVHYYTVSGFLTMLIVCLLYWGATKNKLSGFFYASVVVVLSFFSRFPCILNFFFPVALPLFLYFNERDAKLLKQRYFYCSGGLLLGIVIMVGLMMSLGHWNLYCDSIANLFSPESAQGHHGLSVLLKVYINNYLTILIDIIVITSFIFLLHKVENKYLYTALVVLGIIAFSRFAYRNTALYGLCYSLLLFYFYKNFKDKKEICMLFLVGMSPLILPLGSAPGVTAMGPYSIFALLPLSFNLYAKYAEKIHTKNLIFLNLLVFVVIGFYLLRDTTYAYRDDGNRLAKTYIIENSRYATVLTSTERGAELDSLLASTKSFVHEGDTTVCFPDMPGLHFITNTVPLFAQWTGIVQHEVFANKLENACNNNLPIAIYERKISNPVVAERHKINRESLYKFIQSNNYSVAFESRNYRVYRR